MFLAAAEVFFRHDPIGLNFESNPDEYHPEIESLLTKLPQARTQMEAQGMVHATFQQWFGVKLAGPMGRYDKVTVELWALWLSRANSEKSGLEISDFQERQGA